MLEWTLGTLASHKASHADVLWDPSRVLFAKHISFLTISNMFPCNNSIQLKIESAVLEFDFSRKVNCLSKKKKSLSTQFPVPCGNL